jgi:hypothetical protein
MSVTFLYLKVLSGSDGNAAAGDHPVFELYSADRRLFLQHPTSLSLPMA